MCPNEGEPKPQSESRAAFFISERPKMPSLPKGSTYSVQTGFGPQIATTAVSNAASAVFSAIGHSLVDGDIVEVNSGWVGISRRAYKVDQLSADTFALVDCDTTNPADFPPGSGIGHVRKVLGWVQIPKVMNPQTSGGDPDNVEYEFIEDPQKYQIFNGWSAFGYSMEIDDDTTTEGYKQAMRLTESQEDSVLRILKKGGRNPTYLPCTVALNPIPKQSEGQIDRMSVQFSGRARPVRYSGVI